MSGYNQKKALLKQRFLQELQNMDAKDSHYTMLTKERYVDLLQEVKDAKAAVTKTTLQYRRVKRYNIIIVGNEEKIIANTAGNEVLYFLPVDDIYDAIDSAHTAAGHCGRDRLRKELGQKYANITSTMINLFLSMCEDCNNRKSKRKRTSTSEPVIHTELNSICQIDLIDMKAQVAKQYKYIMIYQDDRTKFILLRALQTNTTNEVAHELKDIFLTFGAPCILHCCIGREFASMVIKQLKLIWSGLNIVHGKFSQSSIGNEVKNILTAWMNANNTTQWTEGLSFVQFMKNRDYHSCINQSPFKAMFGTEPAIGLSTSSLRLEAISTLQTQEDLEKVVDDQHKHNSTDLHSDEADDTVSDYSKLVSVKIETEDSVKIETHDW